MLTAYNGSVTKHLGVATTALEINGTRKNTNFFIVKTGLKAIVGLNTCCDYKIIQATVDAIGRSAAEGPETEFTHLFSRHGLRKRENTRWFFGQMLFQSCNHPRRVPLALNEPLRDDPTRMEKAAIIVKVQ